MMGGLSPGQVVLAAPEWLANAAVLAAAALAVLVWSYWRKPIGLDRLSGRRAENRGHRRAGVVPARSVVQRHATSAAEQLVFARGRQQPKSGDSRPRQPADARRSTETPIVETGKLANAPAQDFDVRPYAFDVRLQPTTDYDSLTFQGDASSLAGSLELLAERFRGRPVAGVLLFTDGNATDLTDKIDWRRLPPVYPVVLGADAALDDVSVSRVSVSQTNFEAAPVTIPAEVECQRLAAARW